MHKQKSMIEIHCSTHADADATWRMLCAVPDALFRPVELHLNGHGLLYSVTRSATGDQTATQPGAQPAHSSQA